MPSFIGPFEVLEGIDTVAYRLALPPSMIGVHEVFHVSMLRKYIPDPAHVVDWGQIEVDTDGTVRRDQCAFWIVVIRFCDARP